ncbi:MAG: FtsQ-type POTRA domain-containing protein [Clostridia bacterium]|nr:FtsQ-type POTRA domain-containing protein [Clostridia bacterium]
MNERSTQPLYVYDRVCPRESKRKQILREYGTAPARQKWDRDGSPRPEPEPEHSPRRPSGRRNSGPRIRQAQTRGGGAYNYRPGRARGGEAVRENTLKSFRERIVTLFESIEERGRRDETIARNQAIAWKKLVEYRRAIFTVLILLGVLVLFMFAVYRLFFVITEVDVSGSALYTDSEITEAAGFSPGDNLYSFDAGAAQDQITFNLPMIRTAQIERSIPKSVAVAVEEDVPAFVCEIWGDDVILSSGLRVLGTATAETTLPVLVLPAVDYSVAGRVLSFADDRDERYIRSVLGDLLASSVWQNGMVTRLDLSDEYDMEMSVYGMYLLRLGGEADCSHKLKLAYKTIMSEAFTKNVPARIDVRDPAKAAVNYEPGLVVE